MAIKASSVRKMLKEAGSGRAFRDKLFGMLGGTYDPKTERKFFDPSKVQVGVDEFSIQNLTEEFCGRDFVTELHTKGSIPSHRVEALQKATQERALFEDAVGVDPSAMQDINAWTATVSGLVEIKLLEGYRSTEFIGDEFVTVVPRRQNGGKLIGVPYVNPKYARAVAPGIEFPTAGLNQLYVWIRPNMKVASKLSLDRETVVYDLSGELMASAETVGKSLQWVREYVIAAGVQGFSLVSSNIVDPTVTAQIGDTFRMGDGQVSMSSTPNPTYQTAGVTTNANFYNYVNRQTNLLADWTDIQEVQNLLNLMRDPVNQLPFQTLIKKILVDPYQLALAQYVMHMLTVARVTGTPATAPDQGANSTFPPNAAFSPAGAASQLNSWGLYSSNIWHQVALDAGVTEANAKKRWYAGDPQTAFIWQQGWDLMTNQANPSSAEMVEKDIVALWACSWMGQFGVREPRYNIMNTE